MSGLQEPESLSRNFAPTTHNRNETSSQQGANKVPAPHKPEWTREQISVFSSDLLPLGLRCSLLYLKRRSLRCGLPFWRSPPVANHPPARQSLPAHFANHKCTIGRGLKMSVKCCDLGTNRWAETAVK